MIIMMFKKEGAYFSFTINNKSINGVMGKYNLPYLPSNLPEVNKVILGSRNKIPSWFVNLFKITNADQKEFDEAKDDNALKEIVLRDAKKEGCKLVDLKIMDKK